jgi:hypothetical protein
MLLANMAFAQRTAKKPEADGAIRAQVRQVIAATRTPDKESYSQEDLEQMRSTLLDLFTIIGDFAELSPDLDLGRLDGAMAQLAQLPDEQLTVFRRQLNPSLMREKLAAVGKVLSEFKVTVEKRRGMQTQSRRSKGGDFVTNSAPFPVATGFCHIPPPPTEEGEEGEGDPVDTFGPERIPVGVVLAFDIIYFLAEMVRDIAQDLCNQVVVALGEGGNVATGCLPVSIAYVIAHAIYAGIHFCDDDLTGNVIDASYQRLGHIHEDLESSVANDNANTANIVANNNSNRELIITNANTNTTNIITNDNSNRELIINNDNSNTTTILNNASANKNELRDLILRTQIEADLAEADSATPVALYLTPNANGGYLDLVKSIVTETLANIQAAGGSIGSAHSFLNEANAAKAAGDFKGAYALYRKAYKMAAK